MNKLHKVIVVIGPTASGKSDFAVKLAKELHGEILSADSRQVYKNLDIGTGKITKREMRGIPHYMLSVYDLHDDVSVVTYKDDALPILEDIIKRGKVPIICGGTGQYIDSLIYTITIPKVKPNKELRIELEKKSTKELYTLLSNKDIRRAKTIDKFNRPRLIRALEIIHELGFVPKLENLKLKYDIEIYCMNPSKETLRKNILLRLDKRLNAGMIDEVKKIMKKGYTSVSMKRFGLEYVIIGEYLEGKINEDEMKEKIVTKSYQYAKRQMTWNKKYLLYSPIFV